MSAPAPAPPAAPGAPQEAPQRGAGLTLALLTAIATVQFFDRALTVVILEPIKREFALGDAQLGVLAGLSYAAAFALAGIPLGWLADRYGVSWQITPRDGEAMTTSTNQVGAQRAMKAMMGMKKLDIAQLQAAFNGTA